MAGRDFAGTWRRARGGAEVVIERIGDAWHLVWTEADTRREGCGIGVADWLYAVRSPTGSGAAPTGSLAATDFDARTGIIVYEVQGGGWPAVFYHPKDAGVLTKALSANAPPSGLVGEFVAGYKARSGEKREAIKKTIRRDGERYRFTWEKDGMLVYEGIGLELGPRFGAAWGVPGRDHEITIFHPDGSALACTCSSLKGTSITTEWFV